MGLLHGHRRTGSGDAYVRRFRAAEGLQKKFGFTPEKVVETAKALLAKAH